MTSGDVELYEAVTPGAGERQDSIVMNQKDRARGVLRNRVRGTALQPCPEPAQPPGANDDGSYTSFAGHLHNRVCHDALIGHGERLGLKSEGLRQRSPLLCDAIGVSLRRVVDLLRGHRINRSGPQARGVR